MFQIQLGLDELTPFLKQIDDDRMKAQQCQSYQSYPITLIS
jgi:hypothetical protein